MSPPPERALHCQFSSFNLPSASGCTNRGPATDLDAASGKVASLPHTNPHLPSASTNAIRPSLVSGSSTRQLSLFTTAGRPCFVSLKPSVTETFCSPFGHVPTRNLFPTMTSPTTTPASVACCVAFVFAFQLSAQLAAVGASPPPQAAITRTAATSAIPVVFMWPPSGLAVENRSRPGINRASTAPCNGLERGPRRPRSG